jgi:hypothetical protein
VKNPFRVRPVTRGRAALALLLAGALDALTVALGPLGWTFADEAIDVAGLIGLSLLLGFHPLFLPTFLLELFPVADLLPTWTACVGAVLVLRKRSENPRGVEGRSAPAPRAAADQRDGPVIDV